MADDLFIDSSLFMGMHAEDNSIRTACKNFFVKQLGGNGFVMNLEQVGRCDELIWSRYAREVQDVYYPFMDVLHTDIAMDRVLYEERDIKTAQSAQILECLALTDRLTVGMVLARGGELVTVNPRLSGHDGLPTRAPDGGLELRFPPYLERLYERSLLLRVAGKDL